MSTRGAKATFVFTKVDALKDQIAQEYEMDLCGGSPPPSQGGDEFFCSGSQLILDWPPLRGLQGPQLSWISGTIKDRSHKSSKRMGQGHSSSEMEEKESTQRQRK